jgi:hypothetical protein
MGGYNDMKSTSQRKLIQTPSLDAIAPSSSGKGSTIGTLPAEPFLLSSRQVRDGIIRVVTTTLKDEPYAGRFVSHLKKIGKSKLDVYSDFEFRLEEYNLVLRFETTSMIRNKMSYSVDNLDCEPDPTLLRDKWLGLF